MRLVSGDAWKKLLRTEAVALQEGKCHYCRCPITMRTATADHKRPRKLRGPTNKDNIAAACLSCNQAKGILCEGQFFKLISKKVPRGTSTEILMAWSRRRVWKRANRACKRINLLTQ